MYLELDDEECERSLQGVQAWLMFILCHTGNVSTVSRYDAFNTRPLEPLVYSQSPKPNTCSTVYWHIIVRMQATAMKCLQIETLHGAVACTVKTETRDNETTFMS